MAYQHGTLSPRQSRFIDEYMKDLNAKRAAIRAGYTENSAKTMGPKLLTYAHVQEELAKRMETRSNRTQVDADYVLRRILEIDLLDVADIMYEDGSLKPVSEWPGPWRRSVNGLDVVEITKGDMEKVIKKLKWPDKLRNLELMGRHVNVAAFKETIDHKSTDGSMTPHEIVRTVVDPKDPKAGRNDSGA